jgi:uncharacterized membrane protein (UPF0127 family)
LVMTGKKSFMLKIKLILFLGLLLLSCQSTNLNGNNSSMAQITTENQGQILPITAKADINGEIIELEVAQTPEQQAKGLMYRLSLEKNRGMLFPFAPPLMARFWMKNVSIPLDMIFLKDGIVKAVLLNVPPCDADPCPVYGPNTMVNQVIELAGGRAKELGVKEGDKIKIESISRP